MGIKNLNKYLQMNCKKSITCISLSELSGKKIVIDVSVLLYRYEGEDALIENTFLLLSILQKYNIIPIFVFDGKSPNEKKALVQKRREDRVNAEKEYNLLKAELNNAETLLDKQEIIVLMDQLKKKIIYITKEKINKVKDLLRLYGAFYIDAPKEADELCCLLVHTNQAWACLSEDMDMFVYGCSRVLRYLSLLNHTIVIYHFDEILKELELSSNEFKEICIISGTDYNTNLNININIFDIFSYFNKYKKHKKEIIKDKDKDEDKDDTTFSQWLKLIEFDKDKNKKIETNILIDESLIERIKNMFDLNLTKIILNQEFHNVSFSKTQIDYENIKILLEENGFVFI
jgi:5'-3' exonuclease